MPIFHAHVPARRYSSQQKRSLADAMNSALVEALQIPTEDRFVIISEHAEGELHLHPTFMDMQRDPIAAMFIMVCLGAHRPLEQKKALVQKLNYNAAAALKVSPDDIFITLIPVPNENFSFGRGKLQLADVAPSW